jgi:ABC-type transport system involved in cytochrome bd biosynthesis fused ATPase/permease subunit
MKEYLFFALIAFFLFIYLLRAVLMVGYDHIKYKNKAEHAGKMSKEILRKLIGLQPLLQTKLMPKGYDYKLYERFQKKFRLYYIALWLSLFAILFLAANLYLGIAI